ncbi:MAG: hypothetical protein ACXACP_02095 [Candidatus Hodarchaeales archaeon]|jgi:hypothetical protein
MAQDSKQCQTCGLTDDRIPLISILYKGIDARICLSCLPQLLHGQKRIDDYM